MAEFQEKLRLQHETSMHKELEKLLTTAKGAEQEEDLVSIYTDYRHPTLEYAAPV